MIVLYYDENGEARIAGRAYIEPDGAVSLRINDNEAIKEIFSDRPIMLGIIGETE